MKLTNLQISKKCIQITKMNLTFPFPHYADLLRLACEAVRISAEDFFVVVISERTTSFLTKIIDALSRQIH